MAICGGAPEQTCVVTRAEREDPASGGRQHALRAGRPPLDADKSGSIPLDEFERALEARDARDLSEERRASGASRRATTPFGARELRPPPPM